jgi:amino acid adenylation domain-containing protein
MEELLNTLASRDIRLRSENGRLKCNAPAGAITENIRDQIAAHKEELLAHLNSREDSAAHSVRDDKVALSYSQRRLLVLEELAGVGAAYILPAVLRLRGDLNEYHLRDALHAIITRHRVLRTILKYGDGSYHGILLEEPEPPLRVHDLQALDEKRKPEEIERIITQTITTPFDLAHEIPLRTALLKIRGQEHLFVVAFHHSAADGWSIGIFQEELAAAYNERVRGTVSALKPLTMQYADYAAWQQEHFSGSVGDKRQTYWRNALAGASHTLSLPTDIPRPSLQTFNGSSVHFALDGDTSSRLKTLSSEAGATVFMTLLAGFGVFLSRSCGQEDILAGIPMHNRLKQEFEPLIGYFSDTVPVRLRLEGNPTFLELLDRIRSASIDAYENQDIPFDELVNSIQPERDLSRNPLVQVMFALHNAPLHGVQPQLDLDGLQVEALEVDQKFIRLDLEMHLWETASGIHGMLFYNTDLFQRDTAEKMCERYRRIVQAAASHPRAPVSSFPLLDASEVEQITRTWNATDHPYSDTATLHEQFHALAVQNPEAAAIVSGTTRLNRRELDALSDRGAACLKHSGVKPGDMVGIFAGRSWCSIVAMLAILKAGGAYVPLDPAYPQARLELMARDAGVRVILTEAEQHDALRNWWQGEALRIDRDDLPVSTVQYEKGDPDALCYLIYTSGSTGTPKGVRVRHRSVINMVEAICSRLKPSENDVWTVFHSHSFDLSVWEIWGALLTGGTLVVVDQNIARNPDAFYELAVREGVTILNQTPTALEQFAYCHERAGKVVPLNHIGCGGESFPSVLAARVLEWNTPLWNFYGPTEATVWASAHRVTRADLQQATLPIGRPFANMRMYIIDPYGNPLPPNIPGELCIGGVGVACGYHNRPELTAEKFTENPFDQSSERHLYHTGDLARYDNDGMIFVLGRMDRQAKLRGFRLELGEIEHALCSLASIKQAVAVMREDNGEKRVVAYIVAGTDAPPDASLKMQLRDKLPEYMVTQTIVRLAELPVSHNGKIDVGALPRPIQVETAREYKAPRTTTEKLLVSVWSETLSRERIGIDDNLFDIGANSLQVVQVQRRLQASLSQELVVTDFFRYPTIRGLAAHLSQTRKVSEDMNPAEQRSDARRKALQHQRQAGKRRRSPNV